MIYVSFGSVLKASQMSDELRIIFTTVFAKLPQRILWKWETDEMEGKPENVMLSKWLPQQDILAHPNLKIFISHMGQSSSQEALCHGKPVVMIKQLWFFKMSINYLKHFHFQIGIPVLGDQPGNSLEAEKKGYGINIPIFELTEEKLSNAIKKILANDSFANRAKEHGTLVMDQITQPIDRAVWWIEYAMRHKGR